MYYTVLPTPLGDAIATSQDGFLTGLSLPGQAKPDLSGAVRQDFEPVLIQTGTWLDAYFRGEAPAMTIPLSPAGSPFRQQVWAMLAEIPYGTSATYGALAARFGKMSAQAVGQAVGANPIAILIPCHRVLGAEGNLTGYAGGLEKKRYLLDLEGIPYR